MYVHKDCPTPAARRWEGVVDGIYLNGFSPMSFNPSEFSKRDFVPDGDFHQGGVVDTINCLDCEGVLEYVSEILGEEHGGKDLWLVERRLKEGYYPTIEWVDKDAK
jgi:hypothetical protein